MKANPKLVRTAANLRSFSSSALSSSIFNLLVYALERRRRHLASNDLINDLLLLGRKGHRVAL